MLSRQNRLRSSKDFNRVYQGGRGATSPLFAARIRSRHDDAPNRIGIIVSGKVSKRAVVRNRIRRHIREALRKTEAPQGRGLDLVIVARPSTQHREFTQIAQEIAELIKKSLSGRPKK